MHHKVVALISGGKDSLYNACHCVANGHELVCLASLHPPSGTDELDSYMYQSVGQDAVHLIAQAMDLPLYRSEITGQALDQSADYEQGLKPRPHDEAESLTVLLKDVLVRPKSCSTPLLYLLKASAFDRAIRANTLISLLSPWVPYFPTISACARLGLQSLAYLWQRSQADLLHEMSAAGMEALIIKVAGAGLSTKDLGKSITDPQMVDKLFKLNQDFGLHVCGEGGEFETFTTDCSLYKKRIVIEEAEPVQIGEGDKFSVVAYLRLKRARLEDKFVATLQGAIDTVKQPSLLEPWAEQVLSNLPESPMTTQPQHATGTHLLSQPSRTTLRLGNCTTIGNIYCDEPADSPVTLGFEMIDCFDQLRESLRQEGLAMKDVTHINLSLADMKYFPEANAVYLHQFGTSPPTRACVALPLPRGRRVALEAICCLPEEDGCRQALHVQGISYWAPANVGPYSQAVRVNPRLFVAGQIGLIPASMEFDSSRTVAEELVLALQHLYRVTEAMDSSGTLLRQAGVCWIDASVWESSKSLPDRLIKELEDRAPVLSVCASGLPRGVRCEWQMTFTGQPSRTHEGLDLCDGPGHKVLIGAASCLLIYTDLSGPIPSEPAVERAAYVRAFCTSKARVLDVQEMSKVHFGHSQVAVTQVDAMDWQGQEVLVAFQVLLA